MMCSIPRVVRLGSSDIYVVDRETHLYRDVAVGPEIRIYLYIQHISEVDPDLGRSLSWRCYCIGKNETEYFETSDFYSYDLMNDWSDSILEFWTISDYGLTGSG